MVVEIPTMLPWKILSDSRYLNILLSIKDEKANNYKISTKIKLDHSQTRKPIKELLDLGALIVVKGTNYKEYLLNKQWLTDKVISYYIIKYLDSPIYENHETKIYHKKIAEFYKLKDSNLSKALVEMYLLNENNLYLSNKNDLTPKNLHSFFEDFSNFSRTSIEAYGIMHIDVDLLNQLLGYGGKQKWNLHSMRILLKYDVNFKKDEINKTHFAKLLRESDF
jgi:hypothetical protein